MIKKWIIEYRELRYLAYHDSLTGLLNRNWLYKNIDKIKAKYVYFIDINNLHEINKSGHTFGDKHIKKCVNLINIDKNNIFIRYAGDEFILFSNHENLLKTNTLYSVGISKIENDIESAINYADCNMIKSKCFAKTDEHKSNFYKQK